MNMQFKFRPNQQKQTNYQNPSLAYPTQSSTGVSLYSSLQALSMIQPSSINNYNNQISYGIGGNSLGMPTNTNNEYGLQGRNIPPQGYSGQLNFVSKSSINNKKYLQLNSNTKNL